MREVKNVTTEQETYTCDVCGDSMGVYPKRCSICNRDICIKHAMLDSRDYGDYPDAYCDSCWDTGEKHRERMEAIESESDEKIEGCVEVWHKEALKKLEELRLLNS